MPNNGIVAGGYRLLVHATPRRPNLIWLLICVLLAHPYEPSESWLTVRRDDEVEPLVRLRFKRIDDARRAARHLAAQLEMAEMEPTGLGALVADVSTRFPVLEVVPAGCR